MARKRNREVVEPKIGEDGAALTADRKKQLAGYVGEIEAHQRTIDIERADQKAIYDSAREAGFDIKAVRHVVKMRTWERAKLARHEAIVDVYRHALGMLADTPLGKAAIESATATPAN